MKTKILADIQICISVPLIYYGNHIFSRDKTFECYVVNFIHEQIYKFYCKTEGVLNA